VELTFSAFATQKFRRDWLADYPFVSAAENN